ncbi:MAG: DUF6629 family protein [Synechococcaceae cyanobacterium]|nr:DUF6629 family protein [Synechococcaceae cyanobacterium]
MPAERNRDLRQRWACSVSRLEVDGGPLMCFSSGASFTAAAGLLPLGLIALNQGRREGLPQLLPLAAMPLGFGLQQALEGMVWLSIGPEGLQPLTPTGRMAALAYLGFALLAWLVWLPLLGWTLCPPLLQGRRRLMLGLLGLGLAGGLLLWVPLLLDPQAPLLVVTRGSIHYGINGPLRGPGGELCGRLLYAGVIVLPLLLVPGFRLRLYGLLVALAFALTWQLADHAFGSLWCYASAVLSTAIPWVMADPVLQEGLQPASGPEGALAGQAPG